NTLKQLPHKDLRHRMSAHDLNLVGASAPVEAFSARREIGDVRWEVGVCTGNGLPSPARVRQGGPALPRQPSGARLLLRRPVPGNGVRAANLSRKPGLYFADTKRRSSCTRCRTCGTISLVLCGSR